MKLRLMAPPNEIEYFLDCACECAEMDGCTAMTLRLYGDDAEMFEILRAPREYTSPSHYRNRRAIGLDFARLADRILPQLSEQRRGGLIRLGLQHLHYSIRELSETMAFWTIEDEIEGGCLEPYRTRLNSRNGIPFKNTMQRLLSPRHIRRYVKINAPEHADHLLVLNQIMLGRAATTAPVIDPEISEDYRAQLNNIKERIHFRHMQYFRKPTTKKERRVINRSLNFAVSLLGRDMVSAFVRGETIKLIGQDSMLMVRRRGRLSDKGHGAISVAMADRNGSTLADLCTYIENTPAIDQLAGFALWMNAGEDRKVLATANIVRLEEGAENHPLIQERREIQRVEQPAIEDINAAIESIMEFHAKYKKPKGFRLQLTHEQQRERNRLYYEKTKEIWHEAMLTFVIGRRNFPIYRAAGALK